MHSPDQAGLATFLSSLERVNTALSDLKVSNLKSNQQAAAELGRLLKSGNQQLETVFEKVLREDAQPVQPLHYITKSKAFPSLPEQKVARLNLINSHLTFSNSGQDGVDPPTAQTYANVRGPYLTGTLADLNTGTINTAKKADKTALYKPGTNGIGMYATALEGLFMAEYDNICALFPRDDWARVFNMTCRNAMSELTKALRELEVHIRGNLSTDCFLGFEIIDIISRLSSNIDARTGQLKPLFTTASKPIRDISKSSFRDLLERSKNELASLPGLPPEGKTLSTTRDIMARLQTMANFLLPVSSLMFSLGDEGWRREPGHKQDDLKEINFKADGQEFFAHYCEDTIVALMQALVSKSKMLLKGQMVQGAFMANNWAVVDRMMRNSELEPLVAPRMNSTLEKWRTDARKLYLKEWDDVSRILLDQIFTSRAVQRPSSGSAGAVDSAAILKGMSSKEKDALKEKWKAFNATFDDLVSKHKSLSLEPEVKDMLAKAVQAGVEPLYARFWDRYHEVDKGKGKYVKYDKGSISAVLIGLMS